MATKYQAHMYFNKERGHQFVKFEVGDKLVASKYPVEVEADTPEGACEQVFMLFNRDDRPNGKTERSLSMGDVVVLVPTEEVNPGLVFWCAAFSFKQLTQKQLEDHMATMPVEGLL